MIDVPRIRLEPGSLPELVGPPTVTLGQPWNAELEAGFLPGEVRMAWTPNHLWIVGTLTDYDVFNDATTDGAHTWESGDVLEVFWKNDGENGYREVHVTPDSVRLHLSFPADDVIAAIRAGERDTDEFQVATEAIVADARPTHDGWRGTLGIPRVNAEGDVLRISVCRYDAHREGEPTISSSSPHPIASFHRPQDWIAFRLA